MAFSDLAQYPTAIELLQRCLDRGRLAHAYLFTGAALEPLEQVARTLAMTLNCQQPPRRGRAGLALDCCDRCAVCRRVAAETHPDVLWVRPESKLRLIRIEQLVPRKESKRRPLSDLIYQKPAEAQVKVGIIVGADRMNPSAANAFLKTLEEPPADSLLLLLSTEPDRLLETVVSRCVRLNFAEAIGPGRNPELLAWLGRFAQMAVTEQGTVLSRYRLLSILLEQLEATKQQLELSLRRESPLARYEAQQTQAPEPEARSRARTRRAEPSEPLELEADLRAQWEEELKAAVEADYRRQRADILSMLQWWLRDVWLLTLQQDSTRLAFAELAQASAAVASRISPTQAEENLRVLESTQRLLNTNIQEALALEVGLLNLAL
jgi:DNA polymerase-3 subunit delta'